MIFNQLFSECKLNLSTRVYGETQEVAKGGRIRNS